MPEISQKSAKRGPGRRFQKGQSGTPGGRPKLPEDIKNVREMAREYTQEAIEALVTTLKEGGHSAKVAAANSLLERGWGKAAQPVTGEDGEGPVQHSLKVTFE